MRAYVLPEMGATPIATDIAEPEIEDGDVLVEVKTASLNPHDAHVVSGAAAAYMTYRLPVVLGSDFCGTVRAVGSGVSDLEPGTRVLGLVRGRVASRGSFADLVAVPRSWVVPAPGDLDDATAGALGLAALTAWQAIEAVHPAAGELVVVNGATGGVGSYAIQLLVARGVRVVATARTGAEEQHVRELGALTVVDWTAGDVAEAVLAAHPEGADAVIDLVSHDEESLEHLATRVLTPAGGRIVSTLLAVGPEGVPGHHGVNLVTDVDPEALASIAQLAATGSLRPSIGSTFEFDDLDEAFAALQRGALGKIAVQVS